MLQRSYRATPSSCSEVAWRQWHCMQQLVLVLQWIGVEAVAVNAAACSEIVYELCMKLVSAS